MNSNKNHQRDSLFAQPIGSATEFRFDKRVADVFPDMLRRSIPGYQAIISQSGLLAAQFARSNTNLYDLGSSLGATSLAMRKAMLEASTHSAENAEHQQKAYSAGDSLTAGQAGHQNCVIHAVDNSAAMIEKARSVIANESESFADGLPIELRCEDVMDIELQNASVVAMNFTLQFIAPEHRDRLMKRIADSLVPGGALILSEKVTFSDAVLSALHIDMYHKFKSANGYSDLEISQKRTALENVLVPDTLETHNSRLLEAGFSRCSVWFQCFNFVSMIAIK